MCVEIVKPKQTISYKLDLPLQEQINDCKEVLIDCNCEKVHRFLDEVEKACQHGIIWGFTIVADNTDLSIYKKTKEINKELLLNDIISKVSLLYQSADNKLKELSETLKG